MYAFLMKYPEDKNEVVITSLSKDTENSYANIKTVELLGHKGKLKWEQTEKGLLVSLPQESPCKYACVIKIKH